MLLNNNLSFASSQMSNKYTNEKNINNCLNLENDA